MNSADRYSAAIHEQRKKRILQADQYRQENFARIFPELNNFLNPFIVTKGNNILHAGHPGTRLRACPTQPFSPRPFPRSTPSLLP